MEEGDSKKPDYYPSIQEASKATKALKVRNQTEYRFFVKTHRMDPRLHPEPNVFYSLEDWIMIGGWDGFIGREPVTVEVNVSEHTPEQAKPIRPSPRVHKPYHRKMSQAAKKPIAPAQQVQVSEPVASRDPYPQRTGPAAKPATKQKSGSTTINGSTYDWNDD